MNFTTWSIRNPIPAIVLFVLLTLAPETNGEVAYAAFEEEEERIGQLLFLHGKEQEAVGELKAGEIGAVAKLTVTATGDTLSTKEKPLILPRLRFPDPSLTVAIDPLTKADLDKMSGALQRMLDEEPTARVQRSDTGEQVRRRFEAQQKLAAAS